MNEIDTLNGALNQSQEHTPAQKLAHKNWAIFENKIRPQLIRAPMVHQLEAVRTLLQHNRYALFDEMGLGKTYSALLLQEVLLHSSAIDHVIICCPKTLRFNWLGELEKLGYQREVQILEGNPKDRKKTINVKPNYLILHYEGLRIELNSLLEVYKDTKFSLVLDESHRIKNAQAQVTQAAFELSELASFAYILSGTPISNRPEDIWAQITFLDQGKALGLSYNKFLREYCICKELGYGRKRFRMIVAYKNLEILQKKIEAISLRRTKEQVLDLPDKIFQDRIVVLEGEQKRQYEQMKKQLFVEYTNLSDDVIRLQAQNILVQLLRLLQLASNPQLIDPDYEGSNAKLQALDEILEEMSAQNEKVVLWTNYVPNIQLFMSRYQQYKPVVIYGETSSDDRAAAVKTFQEDVTCRLFIGNPQAAGEGITLTSARICVFYERTFSLQKYLQAVDRIHRIGTTKTCMIISIVAKNSIDEYIAKQIKDKWKQADQLTIPNDRQSLRFADVLNKDSLAEILSLK